MIKFLRESIREPSFGLIVFLLIACLFVRPAKKPSDPND